jgi:hypothetical protein
LINSKAEFRLYLVSLEYLNSRVKKTKYILVLATPGYIKSVFLFKLEMLKRRRSQVLVAHIYNPSYSGGRDQEDHSWSQPWTNSL